MRLEDIAQIPSGNYIGYYWASDSRQPVEINHIKPLQQFESDNRPNPFILEAQLYDPGQQLSISIRHNGANYHIHSIELAALQEENKSYYTCIADKGFSHQRIKYCDIWLAEPDENCCDMKVLVKKATAFCGFTDEEE